jgi:N-acetylated-alpha-linked acidic dipeptidase
VWDGEEPALLGSTEWGEAHADELRRHAVAYINSDGNGRGYLSMGGSHSLEKFINGVARDIQDPEKKIPVWKRDQLKAIADAKTPESAKKPATGRPAHQCSGLGIGLDRLSRSSRHRVVGLGLRSTKTAAEFTTPSTTILLVHHFSDTDFSYGRASLRPREPRSCDWPTRLAAL